MNNEIKIVAMLIAGTVLITGFIAASCNYQTKLDAAAPVVESCIKHPVTRSPFRGQQ